ncbi:MAG: OmpA family protein [Flavobacteriales bacterium]
MNIHKKGWAALVAAFPLCIAAQQKQQTLIVVENDSVRIEIELMDNNINSTYDDYAPVITADGLEMFFTSRRPYTEKEIKRKQEGKENIYKSTFDPETKTWSEAVSLEENVNIPGRHNSNIAVSNDGQRLLIYQDDRYGNGDIYESYAKGSKWSDPRSISDKINEESHESSASISPDGRTIYFVSERKGGQGKRDIWMCTKDGNGKWGQPKNLGNVINTKEDEEAVFIHPDGKTLYFSSKGHNSIGGYDIFKSVFNNGKWSKPENIGEPINTKGDDLFFVLAANGQVGYYASSRDGDKKNIYEIRFLPVSKEKQKQPQVTVFKGIVKDEKTGAPIEATIEITDNEKNELLSSFTSNSESGRYLVSLPSGKNYAITVNAPGYVFHSENVTLSDTASYQEIRKDITLKKIEAGTKVVLKNIFFDYNKTSLREESISELNRLLKILNDNPKLKIEISGHTDNRGSDEYNNRLSQGRAKSVVEYLITMGIEMGRLTYKGYGKAQPIASNDTEEGMQENRRVEFKILSN